MGLSVVGIRRNSDGLQLSAMTLHRQSTPGALHYYSPIMSLKYEMYRF